MLKKLSRENFRIKNLLPWLWLLGCVCLYLVYYAKKIEGLLDADMSSELVLSQLLAKEHGILSKNWMYSTELRVLNTQLVYGFFFLFTNSYYKVRMASRFVLLLVLGGSFYYLCAQAKLQKWFPYLAAFLLLPLSEEYAVFVLLGDYYIPHIAISFLDLAMILQMQNRRTEGKKTSAALFWALIVLSFLAGLGGPRMIFLFTLPLLLTALLRFYASHKFVMGGAYVAFLSSMAGYLVNAKVLTRYYDFSAWDGLNFQRFSMSQLETVLNGFLNCFGYQQGEVFSYNLIRNGVCGAILVFAVFYYAYIARQRSGLSEAEQFIAAFVPVALLVFLAVYVLTDMSYEDRYLLPILCMLLPLFGMALDRHGWKKSVLYAVMPIAAIAMLAVSLGVAKDLAASADQGERKEIAATLVSAGYQAGYATYWNGNVLTEYSDGALEMYCWEKDIDEIIDVDDLFEWLQAKSHLEEKPEGKVFILLSDEQRSACPLLRYDIADSLIMETEHYVVYGFESYEDMVTKLSTYTYDLSKTEFLNSGEYTDGVWLLPEGATTRGPHMTLYAGTYYVTVEGENLQTLQMSATAEFGEETLEAECIEQTAGKAVYEVTAYENAHFTEFVMVNAGSAQLTVRSVNVSRAGE